MIVKPCTMPLYLRKLEALLRRLPPVHPQRGKLTEDFARRLAGFNGEKELQYHLRLLPEKDFYILHDLRLYDGMNYFQIDILILSRHCAIILEVKNISGILHFDPKFNQLVRMIDGKEEAFPDPLVQIERQAFQLEKFLKQHHFPEIPIDSYAVIANPRSIIKAASHNHRVVERVFHSAKIPFTILSLTKKYPEPQLDNQQLKQIAKKLYKKHIQKDINIFEQKTILPSDIQIGVQCSMCQHIPMIRNWGRWLCPACQHTSKDEHYAALEDYALLFNPKITNQEARAFLNVPSSSISKKILASMDLNKTGRNKGMIYHLPKLED